MAEMKIKKGYGNSRETADFCGTNTSRISDYRMRNILHGLWYKEGSRYYYHLEKTREAIKKGVTPVGSHETGDEKDTLANQGIPPKAISEAKKVFYDAKKKELEFNRASEKLIDVEEMKKELDLEAQEIKYAFDVIPAKLAPMLVSMDDIPEIEQLLKETLNNTLISLFKRFLDA